MEQSNCSNSIEECQSEARKRFDVKFQMLSTTLDNRFNLLSFTGRQGGEEYLKTCYCYCRALQQRVASLGDQVDPSSRKDLRFVLELVNDELACLDVQVRGAGRRYATISGLVETLRAVVGQEGDEERWHVERLLREAKEKESLDREEKEGANLKKKTERLARSQWLYERRIARGLSLHQPVMVSGTEQALGLGKDGPNRASPGSDESQTDEEKYVFVPWPLPPPKKESDWNWNLEEGETRKKWWHVPESWQGIFPKKADGQ